MSSAYESFYSIPAELRIKIIEHAVTYDKPIKINRPKGNKRGRLNPEKPGSLFDIPRGTKVLMPAAWEEDMLRAFVCNNTFSFKSRYDLHWVQQSLKMHSKGIQEPIVLEYEAQSIIFRPHGGYRPYDFPLGSHTIDQRYRDLGRRDAEAFIKFINKCRFECLEHVIWSPKKVLMGLPYIPSMSMMLVSRPLFAVCKRAKSLEGLKSFTVRCAEKDTEGGDLEWLNDYLTMLLRFALEGKI